MDGAVYGLPDGQVHPVDKECASGSVEVARPSLPHRVVDSSHLQGV